MTSLKPSSRRYSLKQVAALLGTGRTTLCRKLRELGMLDANNLATRPHTASGRLVVEIRAYNNPGFGQPRAYGKTLVTERGIFYIAERLGMEISTAGENNGRD